MRNGVKVGLGVKSSLWFADNILRQFALFKAMGI